MINKLKNTTRKFLINQQILIGKTIKKTIFGLRELELGILWQKNIMIF